MVLSQMFDWLFAPITNNFSKLWSIVIISFLLTALTTWIYKKFTNQQELKEIREQMTKLREDIRNNKNDAGKMTELNKKMWELSGKQMRSNFRPMLITFLPLILIFGWMGTTFKVSEEILTWGVHIPLFGTGFGWLGTYILASLVFSIILRKVFKIY
ncbi:DUF106 domain-containing protein [Candidatus Woesearchaeota archaeon]|nr:DUF106 domain-containing protein [Candidatus Woesearchaeota archaeon]